MYENNHRFPCHPAVHFSAKEQDRIRSPPPPPHTHTHVHFCTFSEFPYPLTPTHQPTNPHPYDFLKDGTVLRHGNAKALPIKTVDSLDAALLPAASTAVNGDGDGQQNENNAAVANAEKAATPITAAAAAVASKAAPLMECEGGVCKLVRKPKKSAPEEQAPEETAPPLSSAATATAATATATAPGPAGPAPVPDASAATASRTMECEGDVCKLVRKPKKADAEEQKAPKETVAPAASAAPAATPATATPTRTMECEGGVCKLVRKPKAAAAAAAAMEKKTKEQAEEETPLGVGDTMPSLQVQQYSTSVETAAKNTGKRVWNRFPASFIVSRPVSVDVHVHIYYTTSCLTHFGLPFFVSLIVVMVDISYVAVESIVTAPHIQQ